MEWGRNINPRAQEGIMKRLLIIALILFAGCAQEGLFPREELPNAFPEMEYAGEMNTVWEGGCVSYEREYGGETACSGRIILAGCGDYGSSERYYENAVRSFEEAGVGIEAYAGAGEYGVADTNVSAGDAIIFFRGGAIAYVETRYCGEDYADEIAGEIDESLALGD
jgi:hypothetical protein